MKNVGTISQKEMRDISGELATQWQGKGDIPLQRFIDDVIVMSINDLEFNLTNELNQLKFLRQQINKLKSRIPIPKRSIEILEKLETTCRKV